jgi:2-amino-4-hydroxy-6-hydroxymethyldihydropteridine diphosphokinase
MADAPTQRAYVGIGANLGDGRATVDAALTALAGLPGCQLAAASALYRSAPVDAAGPDFFNAVAALDTTMAPQDLLAALQHTEQHFGRQRPYPNAPRTLDLDLLLHGDTVLRTASLTLPHPRLHQRAFVLRPLLDLAPALQAPGLGALADFLPDCANQRIDKLGPR